ncbi:hypothetical protein Tco_0546687 [Tanacetum coccineum]
MRLPQFTKGSKREGFYQSKGGKDNSSSQVHNGREKDVILIGKVKQKITRGLERAQGMGEFVLYLLSKEAQSRLTHGCHFSKNPPFSSMDYSKRINDFTKKYSVFKVNYDGVFFELPLRYEYGKVLSLKLSNSNRMSYSEMLDMLVYKLECEIRGLFYCVHTNSLEIGCDWIDERVGYADHSLPDISKAEFSNEALLNDGGSSSATSLSFILKRKGKSRVKFTRKRAILKRSKMLSLRKGVRSHNVKAGVAKIDAGRLNYRSLVSFIGLNKDVCDDEP